MQLSTKGRYGLRAMIDLADFSENEAISINSISNRQSISESYLEQLIALLKKAGLVKSIRGNKGGYVLAKPASSISVGDVLRALEGELVPVECGMLNQESTCIGEDSCVAKYVWERINESIRETVDSMMLDELVENQRQLRG